MSYRSIVYFSAILFLSVVSPSCSRERQVPVPEVYVNYTVYLSLPSNRHLSSMGEYLILPNLGNQGIILYRRSIGEMNDFIAMDLTCTNEPLGTCKVAVDDTGFYLICPCCKSKFQIMDGMVASGPAKWSLKEYTTTYSPGGNSVTIHN
jgi:Rieske Fe-S protein